MALIQLEGISKIYKDGQTNLSALYKVDLNIEKGEMVAVMGPSGAGKSTLLNILGCMDNFSEGEYILDENKISQIPSYELWKVRNKYIGFVFQYFALIKEYSIVDNVSLPLMYANIPYRKRKTLSAETLRNVGLGDIINKKPSQLSGGQQQRVAIARAIVNNPEIILADEPTGSLDQNTGEDIMNLLVNINKTYNKTVIIVTHDPKVSSYCNRVLTLKDGRIVADT